MIVVSFIIAAVIVAGCLRVTLRLWDRHDLEDIGFTRRRFWIWMGKGMVLPVFVWMLVNFGFPPEYPSLMPHVAAVKGTPKWLYNWVGLFPAIVILAGTFWAGVTLLWLVVLHALELDGQRGDLVGALALWTVLLAPSYGLVFYLGGWGGAGLALTIVLTPVLYDQLALGNPRQRPVQPSYARALARVKRQKFAAAEREVIRQLEKADADYQGWMLLADLYATRFKDIAEAERLIEQLCQQPDITREQMCEALNRLADWHLALAEDRQAARAALEKISQAFPATHWGDAADRRIRELQTPALKTGKAEVP